MEFIALDNEGVDIVYSWVDGSDPKFRKSFVDTLGYNLQIVPNYGDSSQLFRDNGELRHSLRSIEKFAPWVRRIHVVTNGQIPAWLDTAHPKISIVTHKEIFKDPGNLPTFNSNAIELQLHRISGLSNKFIYFNDDVFLGKGIMLSKFFNNANGQNFFFEDRLLNTDPTSNFIHDKAYAYTQTVANNIWGAKTMRSLPSHSPQLYEKDILQTLENMLPNQFGQTSSHKFRMENDLVMRIIYSSYLFESPEQAKNHHPIILETSSRNYYFLMLKSPILPRVKELRNILKLKSTFFCINDDLEKIKYFHPLLLILRLFLRIYFRYPSSFEIPKQGFFSKTRNKI